MRALSSTFHLSKDDILSPATSLLHFAARRSFYRGLPGRFRGFFHSLFDAERARKLDAKSKLGFERIQLITELKVQRNRYWKGSALFSIGRLLKGYSTSKWLRSSTRFAAKDSWTRSNTSQTETEYYGKALLEIKRLHLTSFTSKWTVCNVISASSPVVLNIPRQLEHVKFPHSPKLKIPAPIHRRRPSRRRFRALAIIQLLGRPGAVAFFPVTPNVDVDVVIAVERC